MTTKLSVGETVVADGGYEKDVRVAKAKNKDHFLRMGKARARHETINGRMKTWGMLKNTFRHPLKKHNVIFHACLVLEQIKIDNGHLPFKVDDMKDFIV